ncbi:hypothetical protein Bra3105_18215 [Brachybacterium halotolerans subsp. kimchii]|uniref:hypothetical protein n=1 Tax=Brachybacterium halotolerans TaxID=2795215 RepID=UPI001E4E06F0|nr:hypothetical protein [Brachybacterium halotolerans]UEJ82733.1 hypothetical protein Bra3105_18215 [Brachybacterium halotolerans subsp. kimchii]
MSEQIIVEAKADLETGTLSEAHARSLVDQIRQSTGHLLETMADIEVMISTAYEGRAWLPLGYESWDALCAEEFTEARMWTSIDERRERTRALSEAGLSTRAIGAVLGVHKDTVRNDARALANAPATLEGGENSPPAKREVGAPDLAGVPNGTPANAATRTDAEPARADRSAVPSAAPVASVPRESRGLDGKSYRKAAPLERVDRIVEATRLHEQGWSQQQIAEEISERTGETVSQRTISEDLKVSRQWSDSLDEPDRERFASGDLPSEELTAKAQIEIVAPKGPDLFELTGHGMRDLVAALDFLRDEVVERDEWLDQQHKASERLGSAALMSMMRPASWLAKDVDYTGFRPEILEGALASMEEIQRFLDAAREAAEAAREAGTTVAG